MCLCDLHLFWDGVRVFPSSKKITYIELDGRTVLNSYSYMKVRSKFT
jgi:hypothetical protein